MAGSSDGALSAGELGRAALITVQELTGYRPEAVTGLEWNGDLWTAHVMNGRYRTTDPFWESPRSVAFAKRRHRVGH